MAQLLYSLNVMYFVLQIKETYKDEEMIHQ